MELYERWRPRGFPPIFRVPLVLPDRRVRGPEIPCRQFPHPRCLPIRRALPATRVPDRPWACLENEARVSNLHRQAKRVLRSKSYVESSSRVRPEIIVRLEALGGAYTSILIIRRTS